jgi:glycosyltransferase involved in cell wall biosynthesis
MGADSQSTRLRVLHIAAYHEPRDVRIFRKECRSLARAGYDVTLLSRVEQTHEEDGVRFVPLSLKRDGMLAFWFLRSIWAVWRAARKLDADIIHFHEPQVIPAVMLLKRRNVKLVYDVHEDAPRAVAVTLRNLRKRWLSPFAVAVYSFLETLARRWCDRFICISNSIARRFPASRTVVIHNYPLMEEVQNIGEATPMNARPRQVAYAGGLTPSRGVEQMIDAIAVAVAGSSSDLKLSLAGRFGPPSFEDAMRQREGWQHVNCPGQLPREDMLSMYANSRAGLLLFLPLPNQYDAMPNKLFEYMAAGLPVIASDFPHWREIIEGTQCGVVADPEDPQAIARAIREIVDDPETAQAMGRRGREKVLAEYNWSMENEKLLQLYRSLAAEDRPCA